MGNEKQMFYQLMYNRPAGDHYVNTWSQDEWINWEESGIRNQEGHHTEWGHYINKTDLEKAITNIRGDTVFCVFENRSAWEAFISEEDGLSGNWRGSKYEHFSLAGEYHTRPEAKVHLESFKGLTQRS